MREIRRKIRRFKGELKKRSLPHSGTRSGDENLKVRKRQEE